MQHKKQPTALWVVLLIAYAVGITIVAIATH